MKRIALAFSVLALGGCASYYEDRYYYADDGYYYEDGYHPRSAYVRRYYRADPYYYDLYDPYLALFSPFGWIYDPWYYDRYRFGVDLYPFRNFGFAFYGGRPWHYSPWYSGYGLYHPYGYYQPQPHRGQGHNERATDAARGLALGVHSAGNTVVRASAISAPGNSTLLGTMSLPATSVNGIPVSREYGYAPASANLRGQALPVNSSRGFQRAEPADYQDRGIPLSRAQFPPSERGWQQPQGEIRSMNGIPVDREESSSQNFDAPVSRWRSSEPWPQQSYPGGERLQRREVPGGWSSESRSPSNNSPAHWQAPAGMPDRGGYGREQRSVPEVRSAPREFSAPRQERFERSEPASRGRDFGIPREED